MYIEPYTEVMLTKNKFEYEIQNYVTKTDLKDVTGRLYDIDKHIEEIDNEILSHSNLISGLFGTISELKNELQ